jgi:hypothetical protein
MTVVAGETQSIPFVVGEGDLGVTPAIYVNVLDPTIERAPASLRVDVAAATPLGEVIFEVDGVEVWRATADVDGELPRVPVPISRVAAPAAGTYTLTVTDATTGVGSGTFVALRAPAALPAALPADVSPMIVPNSTGRWVLQDLAPGGLGSWVMPVNPQSMTSPHFERVVQFDHTTAVDTGQAHVSEGAVEARAWRLAGYYPDESYHDQLAAYAGLKRRFYVIDHRGRAWKVAARALSALPRKRQRDEVSQDNDWAGAWQLELVIYDQIPEVPV